MTPPIVDLLALLQGACHFVIEYQPQAISYHSIREHIRDVEALRDCDLGACEAVDTLMVLHVYPSTPIGSYKFYGPSLDDLLQQVRGCDGLIRELDYRRRTACS